MALVGSCSDDSRQKAPAAHDSVGVTHRATIPFPARAKFSLDQPLGEKYFVRARWAGTLADAVAFYAKTLIRAGWQSLLIKELSAGGYGITAWRGMFDVTGRLRVADARTVDILFQRNVRRVKEQAP